jgi:uncharacterized repeat protein (TIGR02543 family)
MMNIKISTRLIICLDLCILMFAGCKSSGGDHAQTYSVTYNANGATGGTVPVDSNSYAQGDTAVVQGNTGRLVNPGYTFAGWNLQADGAGKDYTEGDSFSIDTQGIQLYAKWTGNENATVTISWDANREAAVNRSGGGYRVYYSQINNFNISDLSTKFKDVPYQSGTYAPTSASLFLTAGTWYVKVVGYSNLGGTVIYGDIAGIISIYVP